MIWLIGFLTVILVLDCLILILLVLVQLPKKEAGMGQAFGGGATDALFGAGSGNALTKMTKYATGIFFVLTFSLSLLNAQQQKLKRSGLEKSLQEAGKAEVPPPALSAPATSTVPNTVPIPATNKLTLSTNVAPSPPPANPPAAEKGK
jgi:protein translocase SecG subunit